MFAPISVEVLPREDGSLLVRSALELGSYANDVGGVLAQWAERVPDRVFLAERCGDGWRRVTYAETFARVRSIAAGLLERGLDRDTPVAILSGNSIRHALLTLAGHYAGVPIAPISPAYSTQFRDLSRLKLVLDALGPAFVFAEDRDRYADALALVDARHVLALDEIEATPPSPGVEVRHARIQPDDCAKILFTSGSTGEPKGVVTTHRMLCSNQRSLAQLWPFLTEHRPVLVDWLPWHHTFGGSHNFNIALFNGGTIYIDDGRPVPQLLARTVRNLTEIAPTLYFNVPRGYALLAEAMRDDEPLRRSFFSSLRLLANAAAALPRPTWEALRAFAGETRREIPFVGEWGATETSPMVTAVYFPTDDSANIGLPGPGTEVLLVPYQDKLEARVRGPLVTPGYWRREDLTAKAFDDEGFYRIGDALRFANPGQPPRGLLFDGRTAENFKLSSGSWVDGGAVRLSVLAATAPYADEAVVAGAGRDEPAVLLFVRQNDAKTRAAIARGLATRNGEIAASSQRVTRALLIEEPLDPARGELTDKGSVNQRRVLECRADAVERLYAPAQDPHVIVLDAR